ncbi:MAG: glycosyltransferase [Aquisalinus sp.]|nr:glycosyltransferase [Aquisalinus sp.]
MTSDDNSLTTSAALHEAVLATNQESLSASQRRTQLDTITATYKEMISEKAVSYLRQKYPTKSASQILSTGQTFAMLVTVALALSLLFVMPTITLTSLTTIYIVYCILLIVLRLWLLMETVRVSEIKPGDKKYDEPLSLPVITILIPLYMEQESVPYIHEAIEQLAYPKHLLDVKLLLEENDPETLSAVRQHCIADHYHVVVIPDILPRTKPKACNYGLWLARGELIVVYDAEDRPDSDQLSRAACLFAEAGPDTACAQAKLNYYNPQRNLLTRLFTLEYTFLFDHVLPVFCYHNLPIPLGGTSNFFRTHVLQEIGGWDPYNVTEDADIGLRLFDAGYKVTMLQSTTWEEATPTLQAWVRQRSRWIKGYIQTWLVHLRHTDTSPKSGKFWCKQLTLQLVVAAVIVSALINPVFWILYGLWIGGVTSVGALFFPQPLGNLAMASFLCGNFLLIYLHMIAPLNRRWLHHALYALLLPLYWLLQSVAGYIALWQLLRKPFYWEKTQHNPGTEIPSDANY